MRGGAVTALDRALATLEEAASSLWRRRPFVLATVGAIAVTLAFPAVIVLALGRAAEAVDSVRARERLRAFLSDDATPGDAETVRAALATAVGVEGVEVVTPERARVAFLAAFPELAPVARELGQDELAFPASVEAWGSASPLAIEALARDVRALPGVDEVRYDAGAAERLEGVAARLRVVAWVAALLALVATAFGIGSVIRMGALARREQLAVMRLVGAPRLHVRLPFIVEGVVQGALGGLLAGALVAAAAHAAGGALRQLGLEGLPAWGLVALVGAPALAGGLSAALAVEAVLRRHAQLER